MRLLCIDTSSPQGSLAAIHAHSNSTQLMAHVEWSRGKSHSELITISLQQILAQAGWSLGDINALAVGNGPGSFTGIRVGVNMARSLAYAYQLPIFSASSLLTLAVPELVEGGAPVLCLVNAFKNMLYVAQYRLNKNLIEEVLPPQALRPNEVEAHLQNPTLVAGDGWAAFSSQWSSQAKAKATLSNTVYPLAESLGALFAGHPGALQEISWRELKPLYIRGSEAEEKLQSGLLKPLPRV